ncbi:MAG TPA: preprotein translocase subunit SecE [Solirubrobacteraceae bacterium]|nr:preprotein translocase subunit SecE [Solirubrobacteraceae bacterium]
MARDRKRAKQRRERRAPRGAPTAAHAEIHRADLPGALEHASGEVDEFDAALIAGAGGVPLPADGVSEDADDGNGSAPGERKALVTESEAAAAANIEPERALPELFLGGAHIESAPGGGGGGRGRGGGVALEPAGEGSGGDEIERVAERRAHRRSLPARGIAFLRASWAELQRVQWPDRPQVSQATAVVLGFVAVAGVYLGAADWVAQKIINFIL